MTQLPEAIDAGPLSQLQERCNSLGVMTWWRPIGMNGAMPVHTPSCDALARVWVDAEPVRGQIEALLDPSQPLQKDPTLWRPGCWIVGLQTSHGSRVTGRAAAMILSAEIVGDAVFRECCTRAGRDPVTVATSLESYIQPDTRSVRRAIDTLCWMFADLTTGAGHEHALASFGYQLSEMYEEIGVIYRIGKGMRSRTRPEEFVLTTCREIVQTLPFRWVAAVFATERLQSSVRSPLAGALISSGDIPAPRTEFEPAARDLLSIMKPATWTLVQPGGAGSNRSLATMVGSQVLAHPVRRGGEVIGAILAGNKSGADDEVTSFETQMLDAAADFLGVFVENSHLDACQRALFIGTIEGLSAAIDAKDRYTCGHSDRVALMGSRLAEAVGLSREQVERVHLAGLLHDVGKIGVPEAVLTKRGRLTEEEFAIIRQHPEIGHRILADIPTLDDILPGVLYHHERVDGRGYPHALSGEQIPLIARILSVADAFDAMSSNRSYRAAMPREQVLAEVAACAGKQFDARLAHAFVALDFTEYDALVNRYRASDVQAAA